MVGGARDRLLVMGGRMSKTALMDPPGRRALDMSGINQIVETAADSVVVGGGITVYDLSRALYAQGRQLPGFTITANPSVGGSITAPTKGTNHPFDPGANGVSGAVLSVKVVRPSGELVELHDGRDDDELALLKDSYSAAGVVAEARLKTLPLASADFHEEVLPLRAVPRRPARSRARARPAHAAVSEAGSAGDARAREPASGEPHAPFDSLLDWSEHAVRETGRALPRAFRRAACCARRSSSAWIERRSTGCTSRT